jgi:cytoskeletal protein CcmA (bactofilin family)
MGRKDRDDELTGFLGEGTEYQGNLSFEGTLRIDGGFTGCIESRGTLVVGEKAAINGPVRVGRLVCSGRISGDVEAETSITLHKTARIQGSLKTPSMTLEEGGQIDGHISMCADADVLRKLSA